MFSLLDFCEFHVFWVNYHSNSIFWVWCGSLPGPTGLVPWIPWILPELPSSHSRPVLQRPIQHHQAAQGGVFTDTNHSGPQTFPALTPGIPGFSVFFLKPGPFPIACSWNSRYLFELIYISSDFDHGDVIKATASYRYVGGFQKVAFFNKKSTSTMVKWHFQGPCFFWFPAVAKIWLKF